MISIELGSRLRIGTAGWSSSAPSAVDIPKTGSQLERYSARFCCAEINTTFYRPHRLTTYARWVQSVPPGFKFSVKAPKTITHEARLRAVEPQLETFLIQARALGSALGPILLQLPPNLSFDPTIVELFLRSLRDLYDGEVVLEPRHRSWFEPVPDSLLHGFQIARVAADPPCCLRADEPGGWLGLQYRRLHGSPRIYYSPYGEDRLRKVAAALKGHAWCILDNTASGAAVVDALLLQALCVPAPGAPL